MRSFPLFLKLEGRPVLLVGAGSAAAAKLRLLGSAGARVTVVAHDPSADLLAAVADTRAELVRDCALAAAFRVSRTGVRRDRQRS